MSRPAANAVQEDLILDAARDLMIDIGIRRTTMAEVARAARVSRATLYRRYPNVDAIAATVVSREFAEVISDSLSAPIGNYLDAVVTTVVRIARISRSHPLLRSLVKHDPEFFLPYLLHRPGRTSDTQLRILTTAIGQGITQHSIRDGDPHELAVAVLLTAWSFALTGPVFASADHPEMLDTQLTDLLTRYLAP